MTATYTLILNGKVVAEVSGTEYAYEAWTKLEELARFLCVPAYLVSNDDSEVVGEYDPEDDGVDEPADIDDDCGFDPYEGCFTWDC
jgi:hypothetical protein